MAWLMTINASIALVVAVFGFAISLRLRGIPNVQARDVRWVCCCLAWILVIWPVRYFGKLWFGLDLETTSIIMVPAMIALLVVMVRMYKHLMEIR